jgi:hypothetical protein
LELGSQTGECLLLINCTDKKEKKIFLIYKEIQKGAGKVIQSMTSGLLKYD